MNEELLDTRFVTNPSPQPSLFDASQSASEFDVEQPSKKRNWIQRTCGNMSPGSARGGLFTLASSAMGASILLLPYVTMQSGLALAMIIMFIGAIINIWSLDVVVYAVDQFKAFSYPDLLQVVVGNWAKRICEILIIFFVIGQIIGFQIIVGELAISICGSLNIPLPSGAERIIVMALMNWCFMVPIASFRDLSKLRHTATVGVLSFTYIVLVTIIEFPLYVQQNNLDDIKYFVVDENIFSVISVLLLAFYFTNNLCTVQGHVTNPTIRRMNKITHRSVAVQLLIYLILGGFGYLSTLDSTPKVFTSRQSPDQMSNGWPMVLGRALILFTLVCAIPLNLHPCRMGIFTLIGRPDPPLWLHLGVTFFLLEFTLILAILIPDVIIVFSFMGALGSITLLVIFPGLIDIQLMNGGILRKTLVILLMIVLALVGIATVIVTIMQIIQ